MRKTAPDKFEATTFEQLKSEQPDHKQAFAWRDGGAKEMSKTGKLDIELLREQRNALLEISQAGFAPSVVEHLDGIINFLDDTLDAVEECGVYCLEEGEGE